STLAYYKLKRLDIRTGLLFLIGSLPGSVVGSWINTKLDVESFSLYFGILMLVVFFMMLIDRQKLTRNRPLEITDKTRTFIIDKETYQYHINIMPALYLLIEVGMLFG